MNYLLLILLFLAFYLPLILNKKKICKKTLLVMLLVISSFIPLGVASDFKNNYGWHVDYMKYKEIHKYSTGKSQKIALIDSGISRFQVKDNNLNLTKQNNELDTVGHGTMMYSLIKGNSNDILGIAPNTEVISIKVVEKDGSILPQTMVKAIDKAIKLNCTVINLSLGSYQYNAEISDIIDTAIKKNIAVVAASGDYGTNDMMFPANKKGVISVGSLSKGGKISNFTNSPSKTTINLPGVTVK